MTLDNLYRTYVGAYYGVQGLDEYELKCYLLKDIEEFIKNFIELNPISNFDYKKEAEMIFDTLPFKRKLQDALIVLPLVNAPIEVILLVKKKIKELN